MNNQIMYNAELHDYEYISLQISANFSRVHSTTVVTL